MFKMRAKQQAALDKRLTNQGKRVPTTKSGAQLSKKPNALEELSKENLAWRNVDAQADLRRWN